MNGLSCPAPDVMLGMIGSHTKRIRIGSGAVLIPHYKPYNIAERYNLLATLFPGRVDLGIGRAPGGSAEASIALSGNFLENVRQVPDDLDELKSFFEKTFPEENIYSHIDPTPIPEIPPQIWLLGTSEKSGQLAVEKQLPYTFGHFMSEANGPEIVKKYKNDIHNDDILKNQPPIIAVSVICAETTEKAQNLSLSALGWSILGGKEYDGVPSIDEVNRHAFTQEEKDKMTKQRKNMIIGNPKEVKEQLEFLQDLYQTDEFMIITITHDYDARRNSYELLAHEIL